MNQPTPRPSDIAVKRQLEVRHQHAPGTHAQPGPNLKRLGHAAAGASSRRSTAPSAMLYPIVPGATPDPLVDDSRRWSLSVGAVLLAASRRGVDRSVKLWTVYRFSEEHFSTRRRRQRPWPAFSPATPQAAGALTMRGIVISVLVRSPCGTHSSPSCDASSRNESPVRRRVAWEYHR